MKDNERLIYENNEQFNEILCKNFSEQYNIFKIENPIQIENLLNDLNAKRKETDLYLRWYDPNMKDIDIYNMQKVNNSIDGDFWLLNNKELYIKRLWIYKYDIGYDFIAIENEPMQTNEIYKEPQDNFTTVSAYFENGEYIRFSEQANNGEQRIRYVRNMIFIISPDKSSMFNAFNGGIAEHIFTQYRNNDYALKKEFFESMIYPNIQRNIRGIITYD